MDILDGGNEKTWDNIPDELGRNYEEMDEAGKERLLKETEKILQAEKENSQSN
ncbi:MAG: hypothetical protein FWB91_14690 [Defluviitaleaceae bacterium]|nr:hypothetical protein [Defluviitaleaceae bacterium]